MDFVETQAQATPEVAEDLAALGELFSKKLYHELTTALRTFVQSDAARQRGQLLLDLEEKFLSKVEAKLNQFQYAMILGRPCGRCGRLDRHQRPGGHREAQEGRRGQARAARCRTESLLRDGGGVVGATRRRR